jgi:hypothetical protein
MGQGMKNLFAMLGLLLAYTFLYAGISHFWHQKTLYLSIAPAAG